LRFEVAHDDILRSVSRIEISRVPASVSAEEFHARFVDTETPVIIEGVPIEPGFRSLAADPTYLKQVWARGQRQDAQWNQIWLEISSAVADHVPAARPVYDRMCGLVPERDVTRRRRHIRLWGSRLGHLTAWHYDGNGLHGLNLQVVGRKYWQIVSPMTPMTAFPFSHVLVQGAFPLTQEQRASLEWAEFDTGPGDLLFLPRFWAHYVISVERWNANINVVFTSTDSATSPVATRERARVVGASLLRRSRLLRIAPRALTGFIDREYGGDESYFVRRAVDAAGYASLGWGILRELRGLPLAVFLMRCRRTLGFEMYGDRRPRRPGASAVSPVSAASGDALQTPR
jgi:hypothetical protein